MSPSEPVRALPLTRASTFTLDRLGKLGKRVPEGVEDLEENSDREVALPALDPADVVEIASCGLTDLHLGEATGLAISAENRTKGLKVGSAAAEGTTWHPATLRPYVLRVYGIYVCYPARHRWPVGQSSRFLRRSGRSRTEADNGRSVTAAFVAGGNSDRCNLATNRVTTE